MNQDGSTFASGATRSIWMRESLPSFDFGPMEASHVDVCVVGAGIAGLTTAYRCLRDGFSVSVLEEGRVGRGETLRTSAHLASAVDDRFTRLERFHGQAGARAVAESHAAAIAWIGELCATHRIDCDFRRVDAYLYAGDSVSRDELERELAASVRAGLGAALVETTPLPSFATGPAIRFEEQAQLDARRYLEGLAIAVLEEGGRIHEHTSVERVEDGSPMRVVLRSGRVVTADHVVLATNVPMNGDLAIPLKQAAYRSYVIGFAIPKDHVAAGLHWDMEEPYHYVRVVPGTDDATTDTLLVGGEDHKTGQESSPDLCFERLEAWARERFHDAREVTDRWSGQIMEPADGIGFAGRSPGSEANVHVITGDSGNGLTFATLGAGIVSALIAGRRDPWTTLYDPSRSALIAPGPFLRENANVAIQYADVVAPGEVATVEEIPPGNGAIVRDGLRMLAVYRDAHGRCHPLSAVCPHLGGIVHWNSVESSWDCPCHGSRFDTEGRVISGPSSEDLAEVLSFEFLEPVRV